MEALAPGLDVALLPISGWGARVPAGHLDPAAPPAEALTRLRPRIAVPIHWGTMRSVGARPDPDPRRPALAFAAAVKNTRQRRPCASSCRGRR